MQLLKPAESPRPQKSVARKQPIRITRGGSYVSNGFICVECGEIHHHIFFINVFYHNYPLYSLLLLSIYTRSFSGVIVVIIQLQREFIVGDKFVTGKLIKVRISAISLAKCI
jgi:hypothetical protein